MNHSPPPPLEYAAPDGRAASRRPDALAWAAAVAAWLLAAIGLVAGIVRLASTAPWADGVESFVIGLLLLIIAPTAVAALIARAVFAPSPACAGLAGLFLLLPTAVLMIFTTSAFAVSGPAAGAALATLLALSLFASIGLIRWSSLGAASGRRRAR